MRKVGPAVRREMRSSQQQPPAGRAAREPNISQLRRANGGAEHQSEAPSPSARQAPSISDPAATSEAWQVRDDSAVVEGLGSNT